MGQRLEMPSLKAEYDATFVDDYVLQESLEIKIAQSNLSIFLNREEAFKLYDYIKESFNF